MSAALRHPEDDLLVAYASGGLTEIPSVAVATHLAFCPTCRKRVGELEALGGVLIERIEPSELSADALERTLAAIECAEGDRATMSPRSGDYRLPEPLRSRVGVPLDHLKWRRIGRNFSVADVGKPRANTKLVLLRIAQGATMPEHRHAGHEFTVVLSGGYSDGAGHHGPGDFATAGPAFEHEPVADPGEDCLCLVMLEGQPRFSGWIGRLLQPFIRI